MRKKVDFSKEEKTIIYWSPMDRATLKTQDALKETIRKDPEAAEILNQHIHDILKIAHKIGIEIDETT